MTRRSNRGNALLVCLFMLVVVSLGALAGARGVISGGRAVNNFRLEALAQEYAELGLRWCESQLVIADENKRNPAINPMLKKAAVNIDLADWSKPETWNRVSGFPVPAVIPEEGVLHDDSSTFHPKPPECLIERVTVPDSTSEAFVITARGFSPGYDKDKPGSGAVVWVQSTVTL